MTCIPLDIETGRGAAFLPSREQLAERRRRMVTTMKQARVVAMVFALGAAFHVMKWAGLLVL